MTELMGILMLKVKDLDLVRYVITDYILNIKREVGFHTVKGLNQTSLSSQLFESVKTVWYFRKVNDVCMRE